MEVKEAMEVIRRELVKHGALYEGFLASITSSLKDQESCLPYRNPSWIAKDILNRMVGEDPDE